VLPYTIPSLWMRSRDPERKTDAEGLAATLYGPSRVSTKINGVDVSIVEKTGYPFTFDIEFAVAPQREVRFPLRLRVPAWSAEPIVTAADAVVTKDPRGYLVLEKKWKPGDVVHLKLRPTIQAQKAAGGLTAVSFGPLVYCLPVPEKAEIVQRFPEAEAAGLKGFFGYQFDPTDVAAAKRPLALRADRPDFGFSVTENKNGDPQYPWDRSPLSLRGELTGASGKAESATLLPMGCTILRRTFFPTQKETHRQ
jgi:hypothetical protein